MLTLNDSFKRTFSYLRLSVTELCNYKCLYCLPEGQRPLGEESPLSVSEIENLASAFASVGIEKIRLTGGEPTLRKDILEIIEVLSKNPKIKTVALTTNGHRLSELAFDLKKAGLTALNVSVDSLDEKRFKEITKVGKLFSVLEGIEKVRELNFCKVKLNVVLLKDFTEKDFDLYLDYIKERDLTVRFIELMETDDNKNFFSKYRLSAEKLKDKIQKEGWSLIQSSNTAGPALESSHPNYKGRLGIISPYSKNFCRSCNRLRVSSLGRLRLCLFGENDFSLRPLLQSPSQKEELIKRIQYLTFRKPETHLLEQGLYGNTKNLSNIGG